MTALRDVSLDVRPGEFLTLIGPSGCGKSTVLNMFAGLTAPTEGQILHDGRAVQSVNTRVGYVTQDDNLLPWRTTLANVEIALELKGMPREARRARALEYLGRVGLARLRAPLPARALGRHAAARGARQDACVRAQPEKNPHGRAIWRARRPDPRRAAGGAVAALERTKTTILFVTHDLGEAIALSDRIAIFTSAPGRIKEIRRGPDPAAARRLPHPRGAGLRRHLRRHLERLAGRDPQGPGGRPCLSSTASRRS